MPWELRWERFLFDPKGKLSLFSASMIVAASMIGVGVFTTSGYALAALGSPSRVMLAWGMGSLIAFCGAISYASLANRYAESGGEYIFLARSLHPAVGLTAGVVSLLAGFTAPIAAAALALDEYLGPLIGTDGFLPSSSIAVGAILLAALLNSFRVGLAAGVQDAIVAAKLLLIVGFLLFSFSKMSVWDSTADPTDTPIRWIVVAEQLVWISFSFAGFNAAIYMASEIRDPKRNVPAAVIGGTLAISAIYLALNYVFVHAASFEVITHEDHISQVAATAALALGGPALETLVRLVVVVALATSVSAMMMTGPRVYAKMAEDGLLPRWFSAGQHSPTVAVWFQAIFAILVIAFSNLKELLSYLGLTLSLCSALAISAIYVLWWRGEIRRLPGWGIPPAIFVLCTVGLGILGSWNQPKPAIAAAITLVAGGLIYPLIHRQGWSSGENP